MNSISWWLLAADMADDVNFVCSVILFVVLMAAIIIAVIGAVAHTEGEDSAPVLFSAVKCLAALWLLVAVVGTLVPSSKTFYLILANEADIAPKVLAVIEKKLDEELAEVKE